MVHIMSYTMGNCVLTSTEIVNSGACTGPVCDSNLYISPCRSSLSIATVFFGCGTRSLLDFFFGGTGSKYTYIKLYLHSLTREMLEFVLYTLELTSIFWHIITPFLRRLSIIAVHVSLCWCRYHLCLYRYRVKEKHVLGLSFRQTLLCIIKYQYKKHQALQYNIDT